MVFSAKVENLPEVIGFIEGILEDTVCDDETHMQIKFAVEEIFVNISSYAYPGNNGDVIIEAVITHDPKMIRITFTDSGIPYDPLAKPDPDLDIPLDERPEGGFGIYLTKNVMDDIKYYYRDGNNVLVIEKYI